MIEWKFTTMKAIGQPGTSIRGAKVERVETDFAKWWRHNLKFSGCNEIVHRTVLAKARLIQRHNFYRWAEMGQLQPNTGDYVPQNMQCAYNVILRRFCATIVAVKKQKRITYSECVSAFLPQLCGVQIASFCATLNCRLWAA